MSLTKPSHRPWLLAIEATVNIGLLFLALYGAACLMTHRPEPIVEHSIVLDGDQFRQWLKAGAP